MFDVKCFIDKSFESLKGYQNFEKTTKSLATSFLHNCTRKNLSC